CSILCTTSGALVADEFGATEEGHRHALDPVADPSAPPLVEAHPADRREDVDTPGRDADLDHLVRPLQVLRGDARGGERSGKTEQGGPYPRDVRRIAVDPHVDIARGAGDAVHGHCVGTDDQKTSVRGEKGGEEVAKILVHSRRRRKATGASARAPAG